MAVDRLTKYTKAKEWLCLKYITIIYTSHFPFTSDMLAENALFKNPRTSEMLAMQFYSSNRTVLIPEDV